MLQRDARYLCKCLSWRIMCRGYTLFSVVCLEGFVWALIGLRRTILSVFAAPRLVNLWMPEFWRIGRSRHFLSYLCIETQEKGEDLGGLTCMHYQCCSSGTPNDCADVSAEGWGRYCSWKKCCGAGAVIILPPGPKAVITNYGSGSLLFSKRHEGILWKKVMVPDECESR